MLSEARPLPADAVGLRLAKITGNDLRLCEAVIFTGGRASVDTVLRRAALSGAVVVGGVFDDFFADVLNANRDIVETVALDRKSYSKLKNHWMRCKLEPNNA